MRPLLLLALPLAACSMDSAQYTPDSETKATDAAMTVSPEPIVLTDCSVGFSSSADLTITSTGTSDLTLTQVRLIDNPTDAWIFTEVDETVIPAGESLTWPVSAALPDENPATGTLRIRSDAADAESYDVALCAYPTGYTGDTTCSG